MEFPGSHHHHHVSHHHNRRDDSDDEDERRSGNFYPPPGSAAFPPQPPAPYSHNEFGSGHHYPTPPQSEPFYEAPPPPPKPFREETQVYSKANPDFNLTIRDGKVLMARADPHDPYQSWFKDERYSTRVKDEEGSPCFALVNKATGQAMKHSVGASHPVQLIPYKPDMLDESVLWAQSKDMGEGFRTIRMVNNIRLNVDAFHGDKKSGGVRDGTTIVLWQWNKGDNQLWKIVRQCKFLW
ncbi:Ricin B-like lectin EULS3 [Linum perenne]